VSEREVDRDRLREKVDFVRRNVRQLEEVRSRGREQFLSDSVLQDATVRRLQVSVEALLDIAHHVIAREALGIPKTYGEIIDLLTRNGLLPQAKAADFKAMVKFRNRAVHLYGEIEPAEVFKILENDLGDFEVFLQAIVSRYF
jgi:uncharacterized protein YutE (UPF0331/DUF86 family)